jgi:intracellular sulfur oxidation DsrE/DsrF family protein
MYKTIFHVDEIGKAGLALKNIKNLLSELGESNVQVELLANSEGLHMLIKPAVQFEAQLRDLAAKKVVFSACANTMKEMGITKESLLDFAIVVPSGVGELVKKQSEGYSYIRP